MEIVCPKWKNNSHIQGSRRWCLAVRLLTRRPAPAAPRAFLGVNGRLIALPRSGRVNRLFWQELEERGRDALSRNLAPKVIFGRRCIFGLCAAIIRPKGVHLCRSK